MCPIQVRAFSMDPITYNIHFDHLLKVVPPGLSTTVFQNYGDILFLKLQFTYIIIES